MKLNGVTLKLSEIDETVTIPEGETDLLIPLEEYLAAGVHIGTGVGTNAMEPFIYRVRPDGLYVLDVRKADERIRIAATFLARFDPDRIALFSARQYAHRPIQTFARILGAKAYPGRFVPGSLTNPRAPSYYEPDVVVVTDPRADFQILTESRRVGIPAVGLLDTDNMREGVDLIIPCNNKGRNSLATVYWLLARQVLRERGSIPSDGEIINSELDDFKARLLRV